MIYDVHSPLFCSFLSQTCRSLELLGEAGSSELLDDWEKNMRQLRFLNIYLADEERSNQDAAKRFYLNRAQLHLEMNSINLAEKDSIRAAEIMNRTQPVDKICEWCLYLLQGEICLCRADLPGCINKLLKIKAINLFKDSDLAYILLYGKYNLAQGLQDMAEAQFNLVLSEAGRTTMPGEWIDDLVGKAKRELKKLEEQRIEQREKQKRERVEKRIQEEALKRESRRQAYARRDVKKKRGAPFEGWGESESIGTSATDVVTVDAEEILEDEVESQLIDTRTAEIDEVDEAFGKSTQLYDEGTLEVCHNDYSEYEYKSSCYEYWKGGVTNTRIKLHNAYMMVRVLEDCKFVEEERHFSLLPVADEDTANYQLFMSNNFGQITVKVLFVDGCFVGIEKIEYDFMSWYSSLFNQSSLEIDGELAESLQMQVEFAFRKFFRGIFKELPKLYPKYTHGNWIDGMANINGEGRLFNMKYDAKGHIEDLRVLHRLIEEVLLNILPNQIDLSENRWNASEIRNRLYYRKHCSENVSDFMCRFSTFLQRPNGKSLYLYRPLFWNGEERIRFLEGIHDILWMELTSVKDRNNLLRELELYFWHRWCWWKLVERGGVFYQVLNYKKNSQVKQNRGVEWLEIGSEGEADNQPELIRRRVDSISFFRNVRHHYNDYSNKAKCLKDIEEEVNATFNICHHVFNAVDFFICVQAGNPGFEVIIQKFSDLLSSLGCLPVPLHASTVLVTRLPADFSIANL